MTTASHEQRRIEERSRIPVFVLFALLLIGGCAWPGVDTHENKHPNPDQTRGYEAVKSKVGPKMQRLHEQALSAARPMSSVAVVPTPQRRVTLIWSNAPAEIPSAYVTGLVGSTNLRNWYQVARLPYATSNAVTLSNRPAAEFYRAYNAIAWQ